MSIMYYICILFTCIIIFINNLLQFISVNATYASAKVCHALHDLSASYGNAAAIHVFVI